ncbi:MAG: hypothetical protein B7X34_05420 [Acidobacteriia bacterium 12-62-4]|nr:MAG: hypothetical protein B7X34_05420 [Acidobacteriia bacterium 12-62-4]
MKTTAQSANDPAKHLASEQRAQLLAVLALRFGKNKSRHPELAWETVLPRLEASEAKLWSLQAMEDSGGEPDVIGVDASTGEILFCDCSAESPSGRRSFCYDRAALDGRKQNKPANCALDVAAAMGITILTEEQYRELQRLGEFDRKTSSWISTPAPIRKRGGALFCDRRYDTVFVYHNGADSYYAARAFRGLLKV